MKTYSIGRDTNCDIVINDSTDIISRRHALLNVAPSGKMTIIDQSTNGTYVNGIRISSNAPVPVTRKDVISLAHVAKLDWNMVPRPNRWALYATLAAVALIVVVAVVFALGRRSNIDPAPLPPAPADSAALARTAAAADSIRSTVNPDSAATAARTDSATTDSAATRAKKTIVKKKKDKPVAPAPDKTTRTKKRAIG